MKRGNRQGSITKTKGGRHWVRLSHPGGRRESLGTFLTRDEAESVLRGALALLAEGGATPAHETSLLTFEETYFTLREVRARDKKAARERNRYKVHLRAAPFAARPLGAVTAVEVQRWVDSLASVEAADERGERTLSHESIKKIVRLARSVFRYAVKEGVLEVSPMTSDIELPAPGDMLEEPWDYLRPAEQTALLSCAAIPESARLWIAFAMGTGMRSAELHRLRLEDVTLDGEAFEVRVRKTKINRPRVIPLFGLALSAARQWVKLLPSFCPKNTKGLFWPRPRGGQRLGLGLPRPSVEGAQQHEHQVWRGYLRAAGIERDLRWYDVTRHTCATSLLCGFWGPRWPRTDVAKILGHRSDATTERYAHVADELLRHAGTVTTAAHLVEALSVNTQVGYPVGDESSKTAARHARFEPATFGSGDHSAVNDSGRVSPTGDQPITQRARAVEVLRALMRGDAETARRGGRALAEEVLLEPLVHLALQVAQGGPLLDARITQLCEAILANTGTAEKRGAGAA